MTGLRRRGLYRGGKSVKASGATEGVCRERKNFDPWRSERPESRWTPEKAAHPRRKGNLGALGVPLNRSAQEGLV